MKFKSLNLRQYDFVTMQVTKINISVNFDNIYCLQYADVISEYKEERAAQTRKGDRLNKQRLS